MMIDITLLWQLSSKGGVGSELFPYLREESDSYFPIGAPSKPP
jgi:hypothetical protein